MNKVIKLVLGIIATILLGALGSGVWEKLLSPSLSYISGAATEFFISISDSYSDSLYSNASTVEYHGQAGMVLLFLMFVLASVLMFNVCSKSENKFLSSIHRSFTLYSSGWTGFILALSLLLTTFFFMSKQSSVFQIRKYSVKQMDILRPYIGEQKFHQLYSNYLQVRTKEDFDTFIIEIRNHSQQYKINIEEFSLK